MIVPEFPKNMLEFEETFGTDEKCRVYLEKQKWPDGFICPSCQHNNYWRLKNRDIWVCAKCEHHCSLTAGTTLEKTRTRLRAWFLAMYLITTSKQGISAKELQRQLGCGYKTAWSWLHKLRRAMIDPKRLPLSGTVEIDESFIGAPEEGQRGRGAGGKTIIICAVEKAAEGRMGRARLGVIENASRERITDFLAGRVEIGTSAHTDGWKGYSNLERSGYRHILTVVDDSGMKAHTLLPRVHRIFSLVKRWILGTHQGSVSSKHLPIYLEEYTFRFNRRTAKQVTHCFQRLCEGVVREKCLPYWQIVGREKPATPLIRAIAA